MDIQMKVRAMEALIRGQDAELEELAKQEASRFDYWHLLAVTLVQELGAGRAAAAVERVALTNQHYQVFIDDFQKYVIEDRMAATLD